MLKHFLIIGLTSLLLFGSAFADQCSVNSYFTPRESIQEVVHQNLITAQLSVEASLFGITNDLLAKDLIYLHNHGIHVEVAVDKRQAEANGSDIRDLIKAGIPVYIKKTQVLEHNKFVIIDRRKVIMGSWNWSSNAEKQDNSAVLIQNCSNQIQKYIDTFLWIKQRDSN